MNEDYWARRRQQHNQYGNAKRIASQRRLSEQQLASGLTWNNVLSMHGFDWDNALAYWDECRSIEHRYPGYRYWEEQPDDSLAWPTQQPAAAAYDPYSDPNGYPTVDGDGYYYVVNGVYYPMPDHHGRMAPPHPNGPAPQPQPSAFGSFEQNERFLGFSETRQAREIWTESVLRNPYSEPLPPPLDHPAAPEEPAEDAAPTERKTRFPRGIWPEPPPEAEKKPPKRFKPRGALPPPILEPGDSSRTDLNREQRIDRVLDWAEGHMFREILDESGIDPDELGDDPGSPPKK